MSLLQAWVRDVEGCKEYGESGMSLIVQISFPLPSEHMNGWWDWTSGLYNIYEHKNERSNQEWLTGAVVNMQNNERGLVETAPELEG